MGKTKLPSVKRSNISKSSNFIQKALGKPGQLHKDLGVPLGQDIPDDILSEAAQRKDKVGQRARFAMTLKGLNKGKRKSTSGK